ncbi:alkaline phosphatase family protein [Roseomonas harenae]|uniref:alkaline phosphatase family protein n=1 Tax=Muricoccus harenae TaxID=2692566 RepID=UPI0013315891|nr:alkaline phosphatase family protein [Roseomonas harenae]
MKRAFLVIMDGLRRDALGPERTPNLWRLAARGTLLGAYRSMFPSATRVVSASTATGCYPARHGLLGNSLALLDQHGLLHPHDAGAPSFLAARRAIHGRALDVPTLAERLAPHGGVMVFSNVSPGSALAHDPDAHGWLLHRAIAHSPGDGPAEMSDVALDVEGDAKMTARFIEEAVNPREHRPVLGVLWMGEPDASQHKFALGSPEAWAAIAAADARLGEVMAAVDRCRDAGEDILLMAGSDHGHETVGGIIDVGAELAAAGLKSSADAIDDGLLPISNGTSVLVHLAPERDPAPVLRFLNSRPWVGQLITGDALRSVGQEPGRDGLLCAISMARSDATNPFGIPGVSLAAKPMSGKADRLNCGQHGGLGTVEQAPVMVLEGGGFAAGEVDPAEACPVDIAPTILAHLGHGDGGVPMDGSSLSGRRRSSPAAQKLHVSDTRLPPS